MEKETNKEWIEGEHPVFGDHGTEPAARTEAITGDPGMFPRKQ